MKIVLAAIIAVLGAAQDCTLKAAVQKLSVKCTIPAAATMTDDCCSGLQLYIDGQIGLAQPMNNKDMRQLQDTTCNSFGEYMGSLNEEADKMNSDGHSEIDIVSAVMPSGLTCTEGFDVDAGAAAACVLHRAVGNPSLGHQVDVSCSLPAETKVSEGCCDVLQKEVDQLDGTQIPQPTADDMNTCQDLVAYGESKAKAFEKLEKAQKKGNEDKFQKILLNNLPTGLQCTGAVPTDVSLLFSEHHILEAVKWAASKKHSQKGTRKGSNVGLVGACAAGAVAGAMLTFAAYVYRASRQIQQPALLA